MATDSTHKYLHIIYIIMYMYLFIEEFKVVTVIGQCLGIHLNLRGAMKDAQSCDVVLKPLTQNLILKVLSPDLLFTSTYTCK